MRLTHLIPLLGVALGCLSGPTAAALLEGQSAPNFTKNELDAAAPAARSLSDYSGKVVVLFLMGYGCPFCISAGPSVEADVWQYYKTARPGEVQVLGADLWNGTTSQLRSFKNSTGTTYPLLLLGGQATGGNLSTLYQPTADVTYDNYVVINKQGVVRYHAANRYAHGNRYHLNEIRGCVDSLVSQTVDVEGGPEPTAIRLSAGPSPSRGPVAVRFSGAAGAHARVEVWSVEGRRVGTLFEGALSGSLQETRWNPGTSGAGVYWVRAVLGDQVLRQRVVTLR